MMQNPEEFITADSKAEHKIKDQPVSQKEEDDEEEIKFSENSSLDNEECEMSSQEEKASTEDRNYRHS